MISVIIPVYNTALLIERAIRSVLSQKNIAELEIIVVDDCSTDQTPDVIRSIKDPRIRMISQPENFGPAAARNRGLMEAAGEYFAYLDGDDYWEETFLSKTRDFLDSHPETIAVSVMQCHKIPGKSPRIVPGNIEIGEAVVLDDFYGFWAEHSHVCTGSVLMRTAAARALGGQREEFRICEDLEFWLLIAAHGKWGFLPEILFISDGGAVTLQQGWLEKNRKRWQTTPTVEEWESRIVSHSGNHLPASFESVRGRIARNLCYSHIMAGKTELARQEIKTYGRNFPRNGINRLFRIMALSGILWKLFCCFLRKREFTR